MKKILLSIIAVCGLQAAHATDLLEVYQQALASDPIYQQAISQRLATKAGVPISLAALLPNLSLSYDPMVTRSGFAGANVVTDNTVRNNTLRSYALTLTLTQTVFNYSQYTAVKSALATSSAADAILNAALQNLMIRVSSAYFAVLKDEDNLSYNEASKLAYKEQLDQVKQQYDVGLKTVTDVYTARASYDSAVAQYIAAETKLSNDRENLRVITGKYYEHLAPLSEQFPLISPVPQDVEAWVHTALLQNWNIKAQQYNVDAARQVIRQQEGGHLPTVSLQGTMDKLYTQNINEYGQAINQRRGPSTQSDRSVMLDFTLPILSGGAVVAQTNQATFNYEAAQQLLEQTQRTTVNTARQSYLNVVAGVSQIKADREAVYSNSSSLEGMEESYNVGAETLVNVLNQQQKLFFAQTQYATDRYAFVNNVLALKQAAGTLGFDDLRAINVWLRDDEKASKRHIIRKLQPPKLVHKTIKQKPALAKKPAKKAHVKPITAKKKTAHQPTHA